MVSDYFYQHWTSEDCCRARLTDTHATRYIIDMDKDKQPAKDAVHEGPGVAPSIMAADESTPQGALAESQWIQMWLDS